MRVFLQILFFILSSPIFLAFASEPQQSIIIEVEGDPHERKEYIETYHPTVDVVATYDLLFNGLALQAKPKQLSAIHQLPFIEAIHPVSVYKASPTFENIDEKSTFIPNTLNTTGYLGKGVKVGVIDTGIDYDHPDLAVNFKGGYDLVDLDEDPQETTEEEGPATLHGTHVAGIIAANGAFQGVAPEAEIYAYRALGPGGVGTSIQVIAAMEQALLDDVDVLNLSLGNSINGPDYPTSEAVNQATEKGVAVVIANGNDGPNEWTVGSPATASKALSVGAAYLGHPYPFLVDRFEGRSIPLTPIPGSVPWKEHRSFNIVQADQKDESLVGKIALIKRNEDPLEDQVKKVEDQGAVAAFIYREEDEESLERIYDEHSISIPVIVLSKEDGSWLQAKTDKKPYLANIIYETIHDHIAPFSSRGPVTQDWTIKPDLVAPGTNILSTVPGGYQTLQGTSMAAPHVAGSIAVLKEARPNWTNEQIFGALKTTALLLQDETGKFFPPNEQGTGLLQLDQALHTETIIDNPNLSFGQLSSYKEEKTIDLTIENLSDEPKTYTFSIPKKEKGYLWHLPQSFTIQGKSQKTISIELNIMTSMLKEGLHQGYLELHQEDETYHLPYAFINKTAQYPKAMGFNVMLKPFTDDEYVYQLYVTDPSESIQIDLFDPDTLRYDRPLLHLKDLEVGLLEGALPASTFQEKGHYKALITIKLKDRRTTYVETDLFIE